VHLVGNSPVCCGVLLHLQYSAGDCGSLACSPISDLLIIVQAGCLALESNFLGEKGEKAFNEEFCLGFEVLEVITVQISFYLPLLNRGRITSADE